MGRAATWTILVAAVLLLSTLSTPSGRAQDAGDLCIVPLHDPTAPDIITGQPWRLLTGVATFPRSPLVALMPLNRDEVWTVTADRELAMLTEELSGARVAFPVKGWTNRFAFDVHGRQVIGVVMHGAGLWRLSDGESRFQPHLRSWWDQLGPIHAETLAYVPAWRATVLGGRNGLFLLRGDAAPVPLGAVAGQGFGEVTTVRVLAEPVGGIVFATMDGRRFIATGIGGPDSSQLLTPPAVSPGSGAADWRGSTLWDVTRLPESDRFLLQSLDRTDLLTLQSTGEGIRATVTAIEATPTDRHTVSAVTRMIAPTGDLIVVRLPPHLPRSGVPHRPADMPLLVQRRAREVLAARPPNLLLGTFVSRSGGPLERLLLPDGTPFPPLMRVQAVPGRRVALGQAEGHLWVFRGAEPPLRVSLPGGTEGVATVLVSPLLDRVLILAAGQLSELTRDFAVERVALPPAVEGSPNHTFSLTDMPAWDLALITLNGFVFALGREGGPRPVPGSDGYPRANSLRILPYQREVIFAHARGVAIIADARLSGEAACRPHVDR